MGMNDNDLDISGLKKGNVKYDWLINIFVFIGTFGSKALAIIEVFNFLKRF
jgi:hypothetical protein